MIRKFTILTSELYKFLAIIRENTDTREPKDIVFFYDDGMTIVII